MTPLKRFRLDLAERTAWTFVQAGLSVITVETLHIPMAYAPLVAAGLAILKGIAAKHVGQPDSASTVKGI